MVESRSTAASRINWLGVLCYAHKKSVYANLTKYFTISEHQSLLFDVFEQHKIRGTKEKTFSREREKSASQADVYSK